MPDFRTAWNPPTAEWAADWLMDPPGLATDRDLETAVILSLFTDATAQPDDVIPDGTDDRRGWWGDRGAVGVHATPPEGAMGSRLWLLAREKQTEATRQHAEQWAAEALAWMLGDGVAARVDVAAAWLALGVLGLRVRILRSDGSVYDARFAWAWEQLIRMPDALPAPPAGGDARWNVARWNIDHWSGAR